MPCRRVPLKLVVGADSPPFLTAGARRLAELIGTDLVTIPGSHVPQLTHPLELVRLVNETFQQTTESARSGPAHGMSTEPLVNRSQSQTSSIGSAS